MACNCSKGRAAKEFIHVDSSGKRTTYRTEIEAKAAVVRRGGSYSAK